jgi:hypothetical protein
MCSLCGTHFGLIKHQQQQQKPKQQQKQSVGSKRPVVAGNEKVGVLFDMGFDDRIVKRALEKV